VTTGFREGFCVLNTALGMRACDRFDLIELCTQTSLKIWNGLLNHKNINKYTWEQHTKNLKTIIYYIITKQCLKLKIQDFRAYRGPNCGTDYKLLVAKISFPYM